MTENERLLPPRGFFTVSCEDVVYLSAQVQGDLPAAAVGMWLVIRMYSWQNPPEFVDIPDERFQALLGYSRQYVSKTLKVLEERGMIERRGRRSLRVTILTLTEVQRQQLFTSTNVYVNNQHEEEDSYISSSSCNPIKSDAQTSTFVDVPATNGAMSTNDDVLKRVVALFEQEIGGTITLMVSEEMRDLTAQNRDLAMWEKVFRASVGKRARWSWIKAVMVNGGLKNFGGERGRNSGRGKESGDKGAAGDDEQRRRDFAAAERLRQRGVAV